MFFKIPFSENTYSVETQYTIYATCKRDGVVWLVLYTVAPETPHYIFLRMVFLSEEMRICILTLYQTVAAIPTDGADQLPEGAVGTVNVEIYNISVFKIISLHPLLFCSEKIITEKATKDSSRVLPYPPSNPVPL